MKKTTSPELIDAVRRYAAAKMSASQIAVELSTQAHPLTRNAIAGIAHRNKIKIGHRARVPHKRSEVQRPKPVRTIRAAVSPLTNNSYGAVIVRPPRSSCSWAGCTYEVQLGDMFCFSHGRKGLMM